MRRIQETYNGTEDETRSINKVNSQNYNHYVGSKITNCKLCTGTHRGKCPAWGARCMNCHRKNHFAKCCLSKRKVDQVSSTSSLSQKNESMMMRMNFTLKLLIITKLVFSK